MSDRAHELQLVIAPVLKRLYPSNPDVVLGREAREIADALIASDHPNTQEWNGYDELVRNYTAVLAKNAVLEADGGLWCPSVDVCALCGDSECDGIGCIGDLDPNDRDDQPRLEQIQTWVRLGRIQEQANVFLARVENRT